MDKSYYRMALYTGSALIAAAGLGTFDPQAGTLTLQLNDIAEALAASAALNGAVFALWGVKDRDAKGDVDHEGL